MCGLLKASLINHIDLRKGLIELKKTGRFAAALLMAGVLAIGANTSINTAEAASTSQTIGSTSLGSKWQSGEVGFEAGCALSEWLGWFECHPSQVSWK